MESWGGRLHIDSKEGIGTKVTLTIPRETPPDWFVSRLELPENGTVVIIDDDSSIHQVWQQRLDAVNATNKNIRVVHLTNPDALIKWVTENGAQSETVYLIDYELLGYQKSGLDLIMELGIQSESCLVTSHYEEKSILSRCQFAKVSLIPKGMAAFVPINFRKGSRGGLWGDFSSCTTGAKTRNAVRNQNAQSLICKSVTET